MNADMQENTQDSAAPLPALPVVANGADLLSTTRLQDVIVQQGGRAILVETPDSLVAAVDLEFPVLILVDLNIAGDWISAIRRCKLRPHTKLIPLYAYGSHLDSALLAAARTAGADHAWARSKMMAELPTVVDHHLHPPTRYPDGWDEALPAEALTAVHEFNAGHYFEQHEHFETAWRAELRPIRDLYQGILQVGLAFLQIEEGNWAGALKMFRRGLPRLRDLPPLCQGIELAPFRTAAEQIHRQITGLGPAGLASFDRTRFPHIEIKTPDV